MVFSSCDNDFDYVFDKTVTERIEDAKTELTHILTQAENGWKTTIIVGDHYKAGSFYCFNFTEEINNCGTVVVNNGMEDLTSEFEIVHEAGVILKFSTRNDVLHWLTVPNFFMTQGFGVDLEYIFLKEENGKLIFRGKKQDCELVLEKATEADWDMTDIKSHYEKMTDNMKRNFRVINITKGIEGASEDNPLIIMLKPALLINQLYKDKEELLYRCEYTVDDKTYYTFDASFIYTHKGILLANPIVIKGKTIQNFIYNKEKDVFEIDGDGLEGAIIGSDLPFYSVPGTVDTFINKLLTYDIGLRIFSFNASVPLNDLLFEIWESENTPGFGRLFIKRGYVSPEGEELGDGIIFADDDYKKYVFIPIEVEKLSNTQFKFKRTEGAIVSNVEGGAYRVENDVDIKNVLDILLDEKGWSMAMYPGAYGGMELYECELFSNTDPKMNVKTIWGISEDK